MVSSMFLCVLSHRPPSSSGGFYCCLTDESIKGTGGMNGLPKAIMCRNGIQAHIL